MKASTWKALTRPLAVCAVAGTLGSGVLGQETQTAPAAPPATKSHVTCADTSPEARYPFFFEDIVGWDEAAKTSLAQGGDAEMAEAWRTRLQKYSGLTAEEAEQVKRVARQYLADRRALEQKAAAISGRPIRTSGEASTAQCRRSSHPCAKSPSISFTTPSAS